MARIYRLIIIILCLTGTIFAQLPKAFTELAHYDLDNYAVRGKAYDVVVLEDSLIFTAFGEAGLYVHALVDSHLVYLTHISDGIAHVNLLIAYDGSILSSGTSYGGVYAYRYEDGQLTRHATLENSMKCYRMIQGPDSTIFLANGTNGLYAYKYDGNQFTLLNSVDQGESTSISALGLAQHPDGTIFLANYYDGIRLYDFDGTQFISKGHLFLEYSNLEHYDYHASDIAIINDSTIASCGREINIYHYSDSSLIATSSRYLPGIWNPYDLYSGEKGTRIVKDAGNGTFVSTNNLGLFHYSTINNASGMNYNLGTGHGTCVANDLVYHAHEGLGLVVYYPSGSEYIMMDNYSLSDKAVKMAKGSGDIIFVADQIGGLKAMSFNGSSFECVAATGMGDIIIDVASSEDGSIVSTVNKNAGLKVYEFSDNLFDLIYSRNFIGNTTNVYSQVINYSTDITSDNKLYFAYYKNYDDLIHPYYDFEGSFVHVYNIDGTTITADREYFESTRTAPMDIRPAYDDNIFIAYGSQGIKELKHNQVKYNGGTALVLDISLDSTLFLANGAGGLRSYAFDTTFHQIAYIDDGGAARGVTTKGINMVFLANGNDGLRAYIHEDSIFTCQAQLLTDGYAEDVIVLPDCTLVLANAYDGLYALSYNGWNSLKTEISKPDPGDNPDQGGDPDIPDSYKLNQNHPNPFNPITTINYQLPSSGDINLVIYDIFGRKINQWSYQNQAVGTYEITWNGKDRSGNPVPSGVYIYRMVAGGFVDSKKLVLLK